MKLNILLAGAAAALLASATAASAATNLVQNGSFETGDFTGWSQFGNTGFTGVSGCFDLGCPTDGALLANFGPVGSTGGITQNLGSISGFFDIFFDLSNDGGNFFSADFGGTNLITNVPTEGNTHYSFTHVAASGPTALTFTFRNDPAWYTLDNVSVASGAPEPAAWALMLTGFFGAGAVLRANRRRTAVAAA